MLCNICFDSFDYNYTKLCPINNCDKFICKECSSQIFKKYKCPFCTHIISNYNQKIIIDDYIYKFDKAVFYEHIYLLFFILLYSTIITMCISIYVAIMYHIIFSIGYFFRYKHSFRRLYIHLLNLKN